MKKIDWNELLIFYNEVFSKKYKSLIWMLKYGYKQFGSIKIFAFKLGIAPESLRKKMKSLKIKINPPVKPKKLK